MSGDNTATPIGDWMRRRYPPNPGATHYLGTGDDPGCCAGPHPMCTYDAAFREGARVERERLADRQQMVDEVKAELDDAFQFTERDGSRHGYVTREWVQVLIATQAASAAAAECERIAALAEQEADRGQKSGLDRIALRAFAQSLREAAPPVLGQGERP